ncbi:MAG: CBS domain-containing protein [Chloroflexota bacterium]
MSPRAAARLERLGFNDVYDYVPGKADWLANGLPVEGELAGEERIGDLARGDAPVCSMDESLDEVRERLVNSNWEICVVVNDESVVLGLLHESDLPDEDDGDLETLIDYGPKTFRPDGSLDDATEYFESSSDDVALVTTNLGELLGVVRADDLLE